MKTQPSAQKDTVYIDVDDEITAIIDKVRASGSKIIALVLPKRATVFQSVVNMKLLKKAAAEQRKNVVLITSEASLLPLAGAVGLHVAPTLQSRPAIPDAPAASDAPVDLDDEEVSVPADEAPLDPKAPVGDLMAGAAKQSPETIEVDNETPTVPASAAKPDKKPKANKKLRVPNFQKFRLRLVLGIALLVLVIIGWILAYFVLPKATVTIKTDTVSVASNLSMKASTTAKAADEQTLTVPAEQREVKKTDTQKTPATGKKDVGTKAAGGVTFSTQTNCISPVQNVPAGTGVSAGDLTFVTQAGASFSPTGIEGGKCIFTSGEVNVVAQSAGDKYNLSPRAYTVAGFSGVSAEGTAMTGGTSKILSIVSQQDIEGAKQKILEAFNVGAKEEVTKQLKDSGFLPLTDTFKASDPLVTSSPNVDAEASEVTVTVVVRYTMTGAKQDELKKLLQADIKKRIDTSKQKILDDGLDKAIIKVTDKKNNGDTSFTLQAEGSAGVQQDASAIKREVAGKKRGEIKAMLQSRPGVKDVAVSYSPRWVTTTPKSTDKITVVFQQSDGKTSSQ
jgi:hypothetical protein